MHQGKVVDYKKKLFLTDCKFIVRPAGRKKVLKTRQKNVHAFVSGILSKEFIPNSKFYSFSYNPYYTSYFFDVFTREKLMTAKYVILDIDSGLNLYGNNL